MSKRLNKFCRLVIFMLSFVVALPLYAKSTHIPINEAFIDCDEATLFLVGVDLGDPLDSVVEVAGIPVPVDPLNSTPQMMVVDLDILCPLDPGTYEITLVSGKGSGEIDATYGTQGPIGPVGPEGSPGASLWTASGNDISYTSGKVGIGTTTPSALLDIEGPDFGVPLRVRSSPTGFPNTQQWMDNSGGVGAAVENTGSFYTKSCGAIGSPTTCSNGQLLVSSGTPTRVALRVTGASGGNTADLLQLFSDSGNIQVLAVSATGKVGIGTVTPTEELEVAGNILATGTITSGSSRELKKNIAPLSVKEALDAFGALEPVKFNYKSDNSGDLNLGFIAEDVPALVSIPSRKGVTAMDLIAVLTKVVQAQERMISSLRDRVVALESQTE